MCAEMVERPYSKLTRLCEVAASRGGALKSFAAVARAIELSPGRVTQLFGTADNDYLPEDGGDPRSVAIALRKALLAIGSSSYQPLKDSILGHCFRRDAYRDHAARRAAGRVASLMRRTRGSRPFGGKGVEGKRDLIVGDIDLEHVVDRLAKSGQLFKRAAEKLSLFAATDARDDDHQPSMQRFGRVEPAEIAGVVGDQHEVAGGGVTNDMPVLPSGPPDAGDVLRFVSGLMGN